MSWGQDDTVTQAPAAARGAAKPCGSGAVTARAGRARESPAVGDEHGERCWPDFPNRPRTGAWLLRPPTGQILHGWARATLQGPLAAAGSAARRRGVGEAARRLVARARGSGAPACQREAARQRLVALPSHARAGCATKSSKSEKHSSKDMLDPATKQADRINPALLQPAAYGE